MRKVKKKKVRISKYTENKPQIINYELKYTPREVNIVTKTTFLGLYSKAILLIKYVFGVQKYKKGLVSKRTSILRLLVTKGHSDSLTEKVK